jgi:hypothetical protein
LSFEILTKLFKYKANEPVYKKVWKTRLRHESQLG